MKTIRGDQVDEMEAGLRQRFEDRMASHLRRFFPDLCGSMSEAAFRGAIQRGIQKAAKYGLGSERETCHFIDLMFFLGFDFERKEPWSSVLRIASDRPAFYRKFDELYDGLVGKTDFKE